MMEFTSPSTGITLELQGVALRLVAQIQGQFQDPPRPQYQVTAAGGVELWFDHDEKTLRTAEDRAAWAAYLEDLSAVENARNKKVHEFLIEQAIVTQPPPLDEWPLDYARWGLDAPDPEDPESFKRRWIEDVVCPAPIDVGMLFVALYRASGSDEEALRRIESFFRSAMEGKATGGLDRRRHPPFQGAGQRS